MADKIAFIISKAAGGGAEHVLFMLANFAYKKGLSVKVCFTNQKSYHANLAELNPCIPITFLEETKAFENAKSYDGRFASKLCRLLEICGISIPDYLVERSFLNLYAKHIAAAEDFLKKHIGWKFVLFLQPSNQIFLYANINIGNTMILSERGEPHRYLKSRYANFFVRNYYYQVDKFVFQTPNALSAYPEFVQKRGIIIKNPIPEHLPSLFEGTRKKKIVNFCRLSRQKNIPLLMDAFDLFADKYNEYLLEIIGNGELFDDLNHYKMEKRHGDRIIMLPHVENVTEHVKDYAMFVSSSDYEGMSNSMLEAMAIGLPTICTDCPIGGAQYVINDGVNGLLVPMNNAIAMADAMGKIAGDEKLAERLSTNASMIRETQSASKIFNQWIELL